MWTTYSFTGYSKGVCGTQRFYSNLAIYQDSLKVLVETFSIHHLRCRKFFRATILHAKVIVVLNHMVSRLESQQQTRVQGSTFLARGG